MEQLIDKLQTVQVKDIHCNLMYEGMARNLDEFVSHLIADETDLKMADLAGVNLSEKNLTGIDFTYANLEGAKFQNSDLNACAFSGANLKGADFTRAHVKHVMFHDVQADNISFAASKVENSTFTKANMLNADFGASELNRCNLSNAILPHSKWQRAKIQEGIFLNSDLNSSNFNKAHLHESDFPGANMESCILRDAKATGRSSFVGAKMHYISPHGFECSDAYFEEVRTDLVNLKWLVDRGVVPESRLLEVSIPEIQEEVMALADDEVTLMKEQLGAKSRIELVTSLTHEIKRISSHLEDNSAYTNNTKDHIGKRVLSNILEYAKGTKRTLFNVPERGPSDFEGRATKKGNSLGYS
ncbi:pentapeptide repeat-containing protein [Flexibacterium corallicola]|uniref:pentapeptide repeat-containing protein n=1 Tax=Flexibacterium corallicola TaxID=3037259 RepID=UPI00286F5ACD|nr:pentapeptide repeat-containing protein [Pseudovibrio sp. M1P-2-3]